MKPTKTGPELKLVDEFTNRYALLIDGRVIYAGPHKECQRRLQIILAPNSGRDRQDQFLQRAIGKG